MRKLIYLLLAAMLVFPSCNPNRVYEEHTDPSGDLEWNKEQVVKFDVNIENPDTAYNVMLALRYAHGYMYTSLPVEVKRVSPSGVEEVGEHVFQVRKEDGSYNGDGSGDIWDLENIYQENMLFPEKGVYHYELKQVSGVDKLHMVMEVGLIVDMVTTQQ